MKSGCDHAVEYIYHYLDGEISWTREQRIRWHLRRCRDCGGAYDFETGLKTAIARAARADVPPELFDRLQTLLDQEIGNGSQG
jgi:mycothiol system anti-sigma-R factor